MAAAATTTTTTTTTTTASTTTTTLAPVPSTTQAPPPSPPPPDQFVDTPDCDPNYAGGCVPIASDVDCAGGSGNGPAYVEGPVTVIGVDVYDLDSDGDGLGCEG
ncbi:MAG: hypothetical protein H0U21_17340 [Acidimicrobiia bacterium]|nr:hypothetical protein [Acidimicrobiia bacterium]